MFYIEIFVLETYENGMFQLKQAEKYSDLLSASEDPKAKRIKKQECACIKLDFSDSEDEYSPSKIMTNRKYKLFPLIQANLERKMVCIYESLFINYNEFMIKYYNMF